MRKRLALCVGINDYPGSNNDLRGCVNDAVGWGVLLGNLGYETILIEDSDATKRTVLGEIRAAMASLKFSDRFVFTYSGHGSWVPDTSGDEADMRDECLVMHDWQTEGFITDDELYEAYQTRRKGVRVSAFSDSCFSGTVARLLNVGNGQVRFFPPELLTPGVESKPARRLDGPSRPGTMLMSGCSDFEVSYDAHIDGVYQGAFSHAALTTFTPNLTMKAWHKLILQRLDFKQYPQTPQLQASSWQKLWRL